MKVFYGWPSSLNVTVARGGMMRQHLMSIQTGRQYTSIICAKLSMPSSSCMLLTRVVVIILFATLGTNKVGNHVNIRRHINSWIQRLMLKCMLLFAWRNFRICIEKKLMNECWRPPVVESSFLRCKVRMIKCLRC